MRAPLAPGSIVISRMGLLHKVRVQPAFDGTITLEDGRAFRESDFALYKPDRHGPIADLETCADCNITVGAK